MKFRYFLWFHSPRARNMDLVPNVVFVYLSIDYEVSLLNHTVLPYQWQNYFSINGHFIIIFYNEATFRQSYPCELMQCRHVKFMNFQKLKSLKVGFNVIRLCTFKKLLLHHSILILLEDIWIVCNCFQDYVGHFILEPIPAMSQNQTHIVFQGHWVSITATTSLESNVACG